MLALLQPEAVLSEADQQTTQPEELQVARQKETVNKSEAIRQALQASPSKGPKEIAADLSAEGVEVTPALVSQIKSKSKGGSKPGRKPGRRAEGNGVGNGRQADDLKRGAMIPLDAVLAVKELQLQIGTANLKALVTALS